jgi:azurin
MREIISSISKAIRSFVRSPRTSFGIIATVALAGEHVVIVSATVFSIVNSVLLRPYRIRMVTAFVVCSFALGSCSRAPEQPAKEIEMAGNDQMKFDVTAFDVKAGQKVSVTLKNVGSLPKEAMGHDFTLLDKNTDVPKFVEGGMTHKETDYIPPDQKFRVLAKTKLLGPGESDTVSFTAPHAPGPYDYICIFPGHYASGMKGVMTVTP